MQTQVRSCNQIGNPESKDFAGLWISFRLLHGIYTCVSTCISLLTGIRRGYRVMGYYVKITWNTKLNLCSYRGI